MGRRFAVEAVSGIWKGDEAKYGALHAWTGRRLPKPEVCPVCGLDKKLELACPGHNYSRNLENWVYMCRSCHSKMDGKDKNFNNKKEDYPLLKCIRCGEWSRRHHGNYCPSCRKERRREWWREYNKKRRKK